MTKHTEASKVTAKQRAKDQSMHAILSAAAQVLSEHGYAGTTISRVAEKAEVSRGLLHYHFKNKEELLAQVLQENMEKSVAMVDIVFTDCDSAETFTDNLIAAVRSLLEINPHYLNLFLEGVVTARHSDVVRRALESLYASFRESLKEGLSEMERTGVISPAIPPDGMAALIAGMLDGFGIQRMTVAGATQDEENWNYVRKGLLVLLTTERS